MRISHLVGPASLAVAVSVLAAIVGCGAFEGEQTCSMALIPAGVAVEVAPSTAGRTDKVSVEQCQGGYCRSGSVRLDDHEDAKRGTVSFPRFERKETRVRVVLQSSSGQHVFSGDIVAMPRMVPPFNSPRCPKGGPQIRLAVTDAGRLVTAF